MQNLKEIISVFFKLGISAFGGPAAHIAMLHKETVEDKKWIDEDHFLDLVGATNFIPGPNSTEMVMHVAHHRGGRRGLFLGGISFILPACFLTGLLAYAYTKLQVLPEYQSYINGIQPVVLILILGALQKLYKKAIKKNEYLLAAIAVFLICFTPISQALSLFIGAFAFFTFKKAKISFTKKSIEPFSIFLVFLKIGSILFGSGYVLIAYLQDQLVNQRQWLTEGQLLDSIAFGQFTPGPVLSTSTFIGYLLSGFPGAILATIGIFLPSFIFVLILNPLIPKMRKSKNFGLLLDSVNAGVIGLMAYAIVPLSKSTFLDWKLIIILLISAVLNFKYKLSSIKMIIFGLATGNLLNLIQ